MRVRSKGINSGYRWIAMTEPALDSRLTATRCAKLILCGNLAQTMWTDLTIISQSFSRSCEVFPNGLACTMRQAVKPTRKAVL